jgi:hypothetical protein
VSAQNNVWLSTEEGDIDINGSLSAKGDVAALAGEGNITFDGPVTAQSDVEAVTGKGYISANANITGASIAAETGQGSITVNGNLTSTLNDIELTAVDREPNNEDGNIAVNGSLDAARDVKLTSVNGDITLDGSVKADGAVTVGTSDGDINVNGDVTGASVAAKADQGSVTVNGGVTATSGDITLAATDDEPNAEDGNVTVNGSLDAAGDVTLTSVNGDITTQGRVEASGDVVAAAQESGSITMGGDVTAGRDIKATTDNGDITVTGQADAGRDVVLTVNEAGDIAADSIVATRDALIHNNGTGDVVIGDIEAGGLADVELTKGDMVIDTVTGDRVVLLGGDNTAASHVGTVTANANGNANGTGEPDIVLGGNYVNVDTVQKGEGSVPLTLATQGATEDQPMKDFTITSLNSDTGTVLQNIWTVNGNIHVDEGGLHISKAYAVDKLRVDNDKVSVALFGATPRREGEDIALWNDLRRNQPGNNLTDWYDGSYSNRHWVNLDLAQNGHIRARNGVVVDYHDYKHFNGDHYSVVNLMGRYLTSNMYDGWYDISYYDRYGLVQSGDGFEENATFDEITVE